MKRVTIQDIAKEMGMSRNTIAKALKNDPSVTASTREKVLAKAYEIGYEKIGSNVVNKVQSPDPATSAPIPQYAILMNDYKKDDFWTEVIRGISERIKASGGICLIEFVTDEEEENGIIPEILRSDDVMGIACLTMFAENFQSKIDSLGKAVVVWDAPYHSLQHRPKHDIVFVEGKYSVYEITNRLIQKGCKRFLFLGDAQYCASIRDRWVGFMEAVQEHEDSVQYDYPRVSVKYHYYKKNEIYAYLDDLKTLPDAIVCANDLTAIYVMMYYKEKHIDMPKKLAITGFDNTKDGSLVSPSLTTVNANNREIGNRIAEQLLWRNQNRERNTEIVMIASQPKYRASSEWGSKNRD